MEIKENIPSVEEKSESIELSESLKILEIFKFCFQPKTMKEFKNILSSFLETFRAHRGKQYLCRFDIICMHVVDYVYKHDIASLSIVSRSLFLYRLHYQSVLKGTDGNLILRCGKNCFLKELREFTDLHIHSKKEELLVDVGLDSILEGNFGIVLYLVKFGLIEFPSEVNEKCRKMFKILVDMFNSCFTPLTANVQEDDRQPSVPLDELLNQAKKEQISVRRSILIFCIVDVIAEYQKYEKLENILVDLKSYIKHKKKESRLEKLKCISLVIQATTEIRITFRDIENFIEVSLNPFITTEVGNSLLETSRKIFDDSQKYYNPRSLKDLVRCKIRSSLRNSMAIPEQVNELKMPVALKKFLNFHNEEEYIFELLVMNHIILTFDQKTNFSAPEIEDGNERETETGVRELDDGNILLVEDENEEESEHSDESDDENTYETEDENFYETESDVSPEKLAQI